jgi:hypothetical protein
MSYYYFKFNFKILKKIIKGFRKKMGFWFLKFSKLKSSKLVTGVEVSTTN